MTGFPRNFCGIFYRKEDGGRKRKKNEYSVHKRQKQERKNGKSED